MKVIKWSGYEWLTQERWGQIHPNKTICWYDEKAVDLIYNPDRNDQLVLKTHASPQYFPNIDVKSNIGVGLVSNTTKFKHGYFEIEAKLPKGKHLWPAFWMWSFDSWPPEIDIFEGYTKNSKGYFRFDFKSPLGFWNINTNLHLGHVPDNYSIKAKTHWMGFKDPTKHFLKYACEWTPKKLTFYYNNKKVRTITNSKYMAELNAKEMNVIINNSVDGKANPLKPPYSEFIVNYFKYEK